ncbi:MAG: methyltransferase domain-containing protein, partial [Chloroflexota bacterium]
ATLKAAGLLDAPLEAAFRAIPRAAFLPDLAPEKAYQDDALPIKFDEDGSVLSSSSQPSMMAIMLRQLQLKPGQNVLEIGTGSGYNAALLQQLVGDEGRVTSVEIDAPLADLASANLQRVAMGRVQVVKGDGANGYAPRANYDRIMATAGIWDVPAAWVRQLMPGGVIVAPLWMEGFEVSAALTLQPDGSFSSTDNRLCGFIPLRGQAAGPTSMTRIGTTGLYFSPGSRIDSHALHLLLSDDASDQYLGSSLSGTEYWNGFLPYFLVHLPETFTLARFYVNGDAAPVCGISGTGFALIAPGSACFVSMNGRAVRSFGGADAFIEVDNAIYAWERAGKPSQNRLRLRLIPKQNDSFVVPRGKVYTRRDHYLLAWMDQDGSTSTKFGDR